MSFGGVIRGFHVYQAVWSPVIGEELSTEQEHGSSHYRCMGATCIHSNLSAALINLVLQLVLFLE